MISKITSKLKDAFGYFYYRITRFYLKHDSSRIHFYNTHYGGIIAFGLLAILLTAVIICPVSFLIRVDLISYKLFWWKGNTPYVWFVIVLCFFGGKYGSKSRYQALCDRYNDEPFFLLKGFGVIGTIIAILLLFALSIWIFVRPLHVT